MQQVKIRIYQPWELQSRLKLIGAPLLGTWMEKDVYYLQPSGSFLKIKYTKDAAFLVRLRKEKEGFEREVKYLKSPERKAKELGERFGIMKEVEKKVRSYSYRGFSIRIQSIPSLGDFLVIENGNGDAKALLRKLGIEKPEYVSLAFSEML